MPLPPNPGQRSHPLKRTFWVPWRGHREFFTGRIHLHVDQVLQASGGQCVLESAAKRGVLFSVWSSPLARQEVGGFFMPLLFSRGQRLHPWSVLLGIPRKSPPMSVVSCLLRGRADSSERRDFRFV